MKKKTLLMTLPFGICIKNFLFNDSFVSQLVKDFDERILLTPLPEKEVTETLPKEILSQFSVVYTQPAEQSLLARLGIGFEYISYNQKTGSKSVFIMMRDGKLPSYYRYFSYVTAFLGFILGKNFLHKLSCNFKEAVCGDPGIRSVLAETKPDLIFLTGPSFHFDFLVAREKSRVAPKSKMTAMVNSWDNLSSKSGIPRGLDSVLVWNQFQENEVRHYYRLDSVEKVGIPQLDHFFQNKDRFVSSCSLRKKYNIADDTKLILYTTGANIKKEPEIVNLIIQECQKLAYPWHLLIRLHPRADVATYQKTIKTLSNVTVLVPGEKNLAAQGEKILDLNDQIEYLLTLKEADVILNIASTVALEGTIVGTPTLAIAFDFQDNLPYYQSVRRYYDFQHMKYLVNESDMTVIWHKSDLLPKIKDALAQKEDSKSNPADELLAFKMDGKAVERIARHLGRIIN